MTAPERNFDDFLNGLEVKYGHDKDTKNNGLPQP